MIPEELEQFTYLNSILNEKLDRDDFMPVGSKVWEALLQHYEVSDDILRPLRKDKSSFFYDIELLTCDVIFIDHLAINKALEKKEKFTKKDKSDFFDSKKMQMSTLW